MLMHNEEKNSAMNRNTLSSTVIKFTTFKVLQIWQKTSLPIVSNYNVERKIEKIYKNYKEIRKQISANNMKKSKVDEFTESCNKFFNLLKCKCFCDENQCNCLDSCVMKGEKCRLWNCSSTKLIKSNKNFNYKILYLFNVNVQKFQYFNILVTSSDASQFFLIS